MNPLSYHSSWDQVIFLISYLCFFLSTAAKSRYGLYVKKMPSWAVITIACLGLSGAGFESIKDGWSASASFAIAASHEINPYRAGHNPFSFYGTTLSGAQNGAVFVITEKGSSGEAKAINRVKTKRTLDSASVVYNAISNMLVAQSDLSFEKIQILKLAYSVIGCVVKSKPNDLSCLNLFLSIQDVCFLAIKGMRCRYQLNWQQHKLEHPKATFSSTNFFCDYYKNIITDVKNIMSKISFWMPYCLASLTIRILCTSLMPIIRPIDGFNHYENSFRRYAQINILTALSAHTEIFPRVE